MVVTTVQTKRGVSKKVSRRSGLVSSTQKKLRMSVSKEPDVDLVAKEKVARRVSKGFSKLKYINPLHLKSSRCAQVKFRVARIKRGKQGIYLLRVDQQRLQSVVI